MDFNILEQDIERLAKNINEQKNALAGEQSVSRETVKEILRPIVKDDKGSDDDDVRNGDEKSDEEKMILQEKEMLPDYMESAPEGIKLSVEQLIDITFKKGIAAAAKEARGRGAFVVDAYHDALTDKLYAILKERNVI